MSSTTRERTHLRLLLLAMMLSFATAADAQTLYSDDFNRGDGPNLGATWSENEVEATKFSVSGNAAFLDVEIGLPGIFNGVDKAHAVTIPTFDPTEVTLTVQTRETPLNGGFTIQHGLGLVTSVFQSDDELLFFYLVGEGDGQLDAHLRRPNPVGTGFVNDVVGDVLASDGVGFNTLSLAIAADRTSVAASLNGTLLFDLPLDPADLPSLVNAKIGNPGPDGNSGEIWDRAGDIVFDDFSIAAPDGDGDGVRDAYDNCSSSPNPDQTDTDADGVGDACDICVDAADPGQTDTDGNGVGDACNEAEDGDGDEWADGLDVCPLVFDPDQTDSDGDAVGDACDVCSMVSDPEQTDTDGNGVGDACNDAEDGDGDEWANVLDVCPLVSDPAQADTDGNGLGDACNEAEDGDGDEWANDLDVCPAVADPDQADTDGNGLGDACNDAEDMDVDEWADDLDVCPTVFDPDQAETDGDGFGDACDTCIDIPDPGQEDADGDALGDACDACTTGLETAAADLGVDLTASDDVIVMQPGVPAGCLDFAGSTLPNRRFQRRMPTSSLTIDGLAGDDAISVAGALDFADADVSIWAEQIGLVAGSHLETAGDVSFVALDSSVVASPTPGTLNGIAGAIEVFAPTTGVAIQIAGATLEANSIELAGTATSIASSSNTDSFVRIDAAANALVNVHDSNLVAVEGVSLSSTTTIDAAVIALGEVGEASGSDGSVGSVTVMNVSTSSVTGSSTIQAGGDLSIISTNDLRAEGSADAATGNMGAGVSVVDVSQTAEAFVDAGVTNWSADRLTIRASTDNLVSSASTASPDGADTADNLAGQETPENRTWGEASGIPIAGALSATRHISATRAYVQGDVTISTTGDQTIEALSTHQVSAGADASSAGLGGAGVANTVVVNLVDAETRAWLDGESTLRADGAVSVTAANFGGVADSFSATSIPGSTGQPAPPSLEVNDAVSVRDGGIGNLVTLTCEGLALRTESNGSSSVSGFSLTGQVLNDDGGLASLGDFSVQATSSNGVSGSFGLLQSGPTGYALSSLTCDNAPGELTSFSFSTGETVTCAFVLDDTPPPVPVPLLPLAGRGLLAALLAAVAVMAARIRDRGARA